MSADDGFLHRSERLVRMTRFWNAGGLSLIANGIFRVLHLSYSFKFFLAAGAHVIGELLGVRWILHVFIQLPFGYLDAQGRSRLRK